jgi:hypothetical protein
VVAPFALYRAGGLTFGPPTRPEPFWVASVNQSYSSTDLKPDGRFLDYLRHHGEKPPEAAYLPASLDPESMLNQYLGVQWTKHAFDLGLYDPAVETFLFEYLKPSCGGFRFLTLHEAIHGNLSEGVEPLARDTSCGFGLSRFFRDKEGLFSKAPELAIALCEHDWENTLNPKQIEIWFKKGSLKDELRKLEKVYSKSTRVFTANSFVYTVSERRQFGHISAKFFNAARTHKFFGAIGEDYYNGGWEKMLRWFTNGYLLMKIFDTDVKAWDKDHEIFWRILNVQLYIRLCADPHAREVMYYHLFRCLLTLTVAGSLGHLLQTNVGYDSGSGDTPLNNCFSNLRVHVVNFKRLCLKLDISFDPETFNKHYRVKICGDDNGCAVHESWPLTLDDIVQVYAQFGWRALPNGTHNGPTPLADFEFAGRKSVYVEGFDQWWPVIPIARILAILQFSRDMSPEIRLQRAEAAALMAFPYLWRNGSEEQRWSAWLQRFYYHLVAEARKGNPDLSWKSMSTMATLYSGRMIEPVILREAMVVVVSSLPEKYQHHLFKHL